MPEALSEADVLHVASLARLELKESEIKDLGEKLNDITRHFRDIEQLDLSDVPPTTHAIPLTNVFREDEVRPGLNRDAVLAQAPEAEDGRFSVPKILGDQP